MSSSAPDQHELDPFDYFAGVASRIAGLGGGIKRAELNYAFHTNYVRPQLGRRRFLVEFTGLEATRGVLYLQINRLSTVEGARPQILLVERQLLADLAAAGGTISVAFECLPATTYCVYGKIVEETDARATGLRLSLDSDLAEQFDLAPEPELSATEPLPVRRADQFVSLKPPTFGTPVSQGLTRRQLTEPVFLARLEQLGNPSGNAASRWKHAYVLQTLQTNHVPGPGVRGLGVRTFDPDLVEALLQLGCEITVIDHAPGDEGLKVWREQRLARLHLDAATADRPIAIEPAYMPEPHASHGLFDFLWVDDLHDLFPSVSEAMHFAGNVVRRLRRRGLGVFMMAAVPDWGDRKAASGYVRSEILQIALHLVSLGVAVAQLRFGTMTDQDVPRPFGLVVRVG